MGIFSIISLVLGVLPNLISAVESVYGAVKGSGTLKKAAVTAAVGSVVDTIGGLPGNAATVAQKPAIMALASTAIDGLVTAYNAVGTFTNTAPITVDNTPATVFPPVEAGH